MKIFYWIEESGLKCSLIKPPILNDTSYDSDFQYFLKLEDNEPLTLENIAKNLKTGQI